MVIRRCWWRHRPAAGCERIAWRGAMKFLDLSRLRVRPGVELGGPKCMFAQRSASASVVGYRGLPERAVTPDALDERPQGGIVALDDRSEPKRPGGSEEDRTFVAAVKHDTACCGMVSARQFAFGQRQLWSLTTGTYGRAETHSAQRPAQIALDSTVTTSSTATTSDALLRSQSAHRPTKPWVTFDKHQAISASLSLCCCPNAKQRRASRSNS